MSDASLRIKNLSISLEALSRIHDLGYPSLHTKVETLLRNEIEEYEKEQARRTEILPAPPARPTIPDTDDDIPF